MDIEDDYLSLGAPIKRGGYWTFNRWLAYIMKACKKEYFRERKRLAKIEQGIRDCSTPNHLLYTEEEKNE